MIVTDDADPSLLFIRRRQRAGDPWSGQMAFPGGFRAFADEPTLETARRETFEETGLDLDSARALGALDDLAPRTPFLPPIVVTPHAFLVPCRVALTPGAEADEVLWIEARRLFDDSSQASYTVRLPTGARDFPAIRVDSRVIWGLTERVLRRIADLAG